MDDKTLQKLVEAISEEFFHKPFRHKALFNNRLRTTGGRYLLGSHNIDINKKYYEQLGEEELVGIIKHELCHYHLHIEGRGYKHQDADFKRLLIEVGAPRYCSSLPDRPEKKVNSKVLIYKCKKCNQLYKRRRKINTARYVCGKCRGKLILLEELTMS